MLSNIEFVDFYTRNANPPDFLYASFDQLVGCEATIRAISETVSNSVAVYSCILVSMKLPYWTSQRTLDGLYFKTNVNVKTKYKENEAYFIFNYRRYYETLSDTKYCKTIAICNPSFDVDDLLVRGQQVETGRIWKRVSPTSAKLEISINSRQLFFDAGGDNVMMFNSSSLVRGFSFDRSIVKPFSYIGESKNLLNWGEF